MDRHSMRKDSYARFHEMLRLRGYSSYDQYLASDAWKQFSQWYRRSDLPQSCLVCECKSVQLHHWTYDNIGQDRPCDVIPLCEAHHHALHCWLISSKTPLSQVEVQLRLCFGFDSKKAEESFLPFLKMQRAMSQPDLLRCRDCREPLPRKWKSSCCRNCTVVRTEARKKTARHSVDSKKHAKRKPSSLVPGLFCSTCGIDLPPVPPSSKRPECEVCSAVVIQKGHKLPIGQRTALAPRPLRKN